MCNQTPFVRRYLHNATYFYNYFDNGVMMTVKSRFFLLFSTFVLNVILYSVVSLLFISLLLFYCFALFLFLFIIFCFIFSLFLFLLSLLLFFFLMRIKEKLKPSGFR